MPRGHGLLRRPASDSRLEKMHLSKIIGQRAIVIGAGIAGLAAARALADSFAQVVILERDTLNQDAAPRVGVPQGKQPHALLVGGLRALTDQFPNFLDRFIRSGAVAYDYSRARIEMGGIDPLPQRDLGIPIYSASRPLIEYAIRQELAQTHNVTLQEQSRVEALTLSERGAISGARYSALGADHTLSADLVVDASGRGVPSLKLLDSIGCAHPDTSSIGINIDYSTAIFARPKDAPTDWVFLATLPNAPKERHGGLIMPIENDQWMVTMSARHPQSPPPATGAEFLAHAEGLRTKTLFNAIREAERITPIARHRFTGSVRVHWERQEGLPRGLLLLGDAACHFNPLFGQGMSAAAQEALVLKRLLASAADESDPLGWLQPMYFKKLAEVLEAPWSVAVSDMIYPETTGTRPAALQRSMQFAAGLMRLAVQDPEIHKLMMEVQQLLKSPSVYNDPELHRRVAEVMSGPNA
jgi:2-polyprenyl-6-methoxyphenol hydroxylase-like FAD-dependent oxidoreductase